MTDIKQTNTMSVKTVINLSKLTKLQDSISALEKRLDNLNSFVSTSITMSTLNVNSEISQKSEYSTTKNTKKCQPSEWDRQDLIQTWPVPQ